MTTAPGGSNQSLDITADYKPLEGSAEERGSIRRAVREGVEEARADIRGLFGVAAVEDDVAFAFSDVDSVCDIVIVIVVHKSMGDWRWTWAIPSSVSSTWRMRVASRGRSSFQIHLAFLSVMPFRVWILLQVHMELRVLAYTGTTSKLLLQARQELCLAAKQGDST